MRARVAALAAGDFEQQRFGADRHRYRLREPLSGAAVEEFEHRHGVRLPEAYRRFLTEVADGGAGPEYGVLGLFEEVDEAGVLHGERAEALRPGFLATAFPHTAARLRRDGYAVTGSLVIGEGCCGQFSRLVVTGPSAGQVWLDDQVRGALTPGPDFRDWYLAWLGSG
ncbi:SMI1/KNR4 family protein [Streptomyces tateyamensis]|uniref:SMI1/KNR4 family protein n=1 Tax=Streptomyces tateyamensis TaxID=565073 RepID=UPI001FE73EB0|nr:SMI1/KNR4 family protein [Streptomyces tateyamensis]